MTGYTVHTGSSKKFAQGWDQIFQGKPRGKTAKASGKKAGKSGATSQPVKAAKKMRKSK